MLRYFCNFKQIHTMALLNEYNHKDTEVRIKITINQTTMNTFLGSDSPFV